MVLGTGDAREDPVSYHRDSIILALASDHKSRGPRQQGRVQTVDLHIVFHWLCMERVDSKGLLAYNLLFVRGSSGPEWGGSNKFGAVSWKGIIFGPGTL